MDSIVSLSEVKMINFTKKVKKLTVEYLKLMVFILDFLQKKRLRSARENKFEISEILEEYEEPVSLYLVISHKISNLT